jgi:hypothetical protein
LFCWGSMRQRTIYHSLNGLRDGSEAHSLHVYSHMILSWIEIDADDHDDETMKMMMTWVTESPVDHSLIIRKILLILHSSEILTYLSFKSNKLPFSSFLILQGKMSENHHSSMKGKAFSHFNSS